ncbi:MAG: hypothetical protein JSU82_16080 [Rhodospirillales bacterium]|nr:MAG: hypothetical protein JSU82_16080 [Rhodospirillales bacterium]
MLSRFRLPVLSVLLFAVAIVPSAAEPKSVDFSRLVVVGDSLSAGYQNSCLLGTQQVNSYANLVAQRAGANLQLPLIGEPGFPPCLVLIDPGPPPLVDLVSTAFGIRLDPTVRTRNLSVPGARVGDALDAAPSNGFHGLFGLPFAELHAAVLQGHGGVPRSQVDLAIELEPTALIVWLGGNDVLWAAIGGDPIFVTPEAVFRAGYEDMLARLAATGAAMLVANIPDATTIPFLTAAEAVEEIAGVPMAVFGLAPGDYVTPLAWRFVLTGAPLPDGVVVDAAELAQIQTAIDGFNEIIAEQAALHGAALVDMNAVLRFVSQFGVVVGGRRLTADFLGGMFTLDGIHPTNTGHAVMANEFIRGFNRAFGAGLRPYSTREIEAIMDADPLVFDSTGNPPWSPTALEVLRDLDVIGAGAF